MLSNCSVPLHVSSPIFYHFFNPWEIAGCGYYIRLTQWEAGKSQWRVGCPLQNESDELLNASQAGWVSSCQCTVVFAPARKMGEKSRGSPHGLWASIWLLPGKVVLLSGLEQPRLFPGHWKLARELPWVSLWPHALWLRTFSLPGLGTPWSSIFSSGSVWFN